MLQTKISGLAVDTEYSFHLVLRTTGGTFSSPVLAVRTHKMTDLSGITVTPGILPQPLRESLERAVERIGAKIVDGVRIDTTHFVCVEGRGSDWEKAAEMNIPIVRPEWLDGCEREGRIVGVRGYYLNANPKDRQMPSISGPSGDTMRQGSTTEPQTGASTTSLPTRNAPEYDQQRISTPEREGYIAGPGNGPGPEVPPTPPPKDQSRSSGEEEEEDDDEDESGTETGEPPPGEAEKHEDDDTTLAGSESQGRKAAVEDEEAEENMEEVAL